jgi:WD40 repeat protein
VIAFFEVISESAPHIYHTALPLSPQTSIVHKLYKQYAHPLGRVVQGSPISWEPNVAMVYYPSMPIAVAWSPCCRFIAVAPYNSGTIEILDAVTFKQLNTFLFHEDIHGGVSFSPDSHLLVGIGLKQTLISWDLQTGGLVTTSPSGPHMSDAYYSSLTYSMDGKMIAAVHSGMHGITPTISTYNLLSGTCTYSHHILEGQIVDPIWTHGECLRFATAKPGSITLWEVGFTSIDTLVEVESLPAPDIDSYSGHYLFLPTHFRLAFTLQETVLIWDAQDSKLLLNVVVNSSAQHKSFSPDGCFFACETGGSKISLWKESPTGYILHQTFPSGTFGTSALLISPSGESIIIGTINAVQLWHTADPVTSLSSIPAKSVQHAEFVLEFSPDGTLAAVAQREKHMVMVLNLKSGNSWLTIDTGMKILALRVTGSTVVVVGEGRVVTWNLPAGDCDLDARANINDSVQTVVFNNPAPLPGLPAPYTSLSPNCNYIAFKVELLGINICDESTGRCLDLNIYDMSTGKCLAVATEGLRPWFTPDGHEVWCANHAQEGWTIVEEANSDLIRLEPLGPTACPPGGFPWQSPHGYEIRNDGWVLSPSKKQLFWLPHHWRGDLKWGGRFLGLLRCELPAAVILEFYE